MSERTGFFAFAHSRCTLPGVSSPASVVRSMFVTAEGRGEERVRGCVRGTGGILAGAIFARRNSAQFLQLHRRHARVYARRLGAEVTVVEFLDRITPGMDDEIAKTFQRTLKKQGIKFQLKTKVMGAAVKGDKAVLTTEPVKGGDQTEMEADVVLVSTGRIPFTDGLGLENVGIKVSARGQVEVDDHFATNVAGVYAIGDVVRGAMLSLIHISEPTRP